MEREKGRRAEAGKRAARRAQEGAHEGSWDIVTPGRTPLAIVAALTASGVLPALLAAGLDALLAPLPGWAPLAGLFALAAAAVAAWPVRRR